MTGTSEKPMTYGLLDKALHGFKDKHLLSVALTRRSLAKEREPEHLEDNERLEWLDAVINLAISSNLYMNNKGFEKELHKLRQYFVNGNHETRISKQLGLERYITPSKVEKQSWGRSESKILRDTYEALVGAIYIDQGYEKAVEFVVETLIELK